MNKKYICDCGIEYIPNPKYKDVRVKCDVCIKNTKAAAVKKRAVEYLNNKCEDCGLKSDYIVIYDFDHKDPAQKSFKISGKAIYRWEELKTELNKCSLRCSNCHRLRHYLLDQLKKSKKNLKST